MNNIENLTIEDINWLLKDYNRIRNFGKVNSWIDWHIKAQQLIKGKAEKPSCTCMWVAAAQVANSMYEQHEQLLKNRLAQLESLVIDEPKPDTTVTKRGRGRSKTNPQA